MIRPSAARDGKDIAEVYNHCIINSIATFEIEPVDSEEMARRAQKAHLFLVAEEHNEVPGYAYLAKYHSRQAYRHTAEASVYLKPEAQGKGLGRQLYQALFDQAPQYGIREIVSIIALPNGSSEQLHRKMGFKKAGVLERSGYKFGQYIDTAFWQLWLA